MKNSFERCGFGMVLSITWRMKLVNQTSQVVNSKKQTKSLIFFLCEKTILKNSTERQWLNSWLGIFPSPLQTGSPLSALRRAPGVTTHRPCLWPFGLLGFLLGSANGELTRTGALRELFVANQNLCLMTALG